jgi:hypothetical protein
MELDKIILLMEDEFGILQGMIFTRIFSPYYISSFRLPFSYFYLLQK